MKLFSDLLFFVLFSVEISPKCPHGHDKMLFVVIQVLRHERICGLHDYVGPYFLVKMSLFEISLRRKVVVSYVVIKQVRPFVPKITDYCNTVYNVVHC